MNSRNVNQFLKSTYYGYSRFDYLLSKDKNIGDNGENLTIVVLSYNRSSATIKLMDSIIEYVPNYKGYILIADNASEKDEKNIIKKYIENSPLNIEFVEFDKNYGVAGGRNRAFLMVKTDWILSLDNDIYLVDNPLNKIQETISLLGVKFLNLPLLSEDKKTIFTNGGALYVDYYINGPLIGGGSLFDQCKIEEVGELDPTVSTFLLGGASIFNKEEFIRCGKFDDNMFIGFEDLDFSITLFNKGMKIGNAPIFSLVHDHTIKTDKTSLDYEKTRFSHGILKDSGLYFEKKHGFKVWNANVENWIIQRQKDLGIIDENLETKITESRRPHIGLVIDLKGWAFSNIATEIKKNLSEYYDFEIIPLQDFDNNVAKILVYTKKFDLVHFFWRGHLSFIDSYQEYMKSLGMNLQDFYNQIIYPQRITTAVYDHLYLDNLDFTNGMLNKCINYTVSSNLLKNIYDNENGIIKKPQMVITDGVDLDLFKPTDLDRFKKHKKLVIGWVGNSAWSQDIEDFKGFNTILKPLLEELINEKYPIECIFADRQQGMIPHDKMPDYYSKVDVILCASKIEGTPNPILEAMACGVPVITTNVGIVSEALGKKQKHYIVERTKEAFKEKIIELTENRYLLQELSKENLKQIQNWSWKQKTEDFKKFFDENLKVSK